MIDDLIEHFVTWQQQAEQAQDTARDPDKHINPAVWEAYCSGRSDALQQAVLELARVMEGKRG